MLHPVARANIINMVRTWVPDRVVYNYHKRTRNIVPSDWTIDYIPEGFEVSELYSDDLGYDIYYFDDSNRLLNISFSGDAGSLHIDNEHHDIYQW